MNKTALITGITGQDGRFLAALLASKGYEVIGVSRGSRHKQPLHLSSLQIEVELEVVDMLNAFCVSKVVAKHKPDEIYHLASQSAPTLSWVNPKETAEANCIGTLNLIEAVRKECPEAKFYNASSCEMFGGSPATLQCEKTDFLPLNPYAATKIFSHQISSIYRSTHQLFISNGILFHHESELRPLNFVMQKIAYGAACASLDIQNSPEVCADGTPVFVNRKLPLGNLEIRRDWGFAGDYVEAMWLMLQHNRPDDFVIATGQTHSIKEICQTAFAHVNKVWSDYIYSDPDFLRSNENMESRGDPKKAIEVLGWKPKVGFDSLVRRMVDFQIAKLTKSL